MNKLILINGKPGSGKTTLSKELLSRLDKAAWIEVDNLMQVTPWNYDQALIDLALKSASNLVSNYMQAGYTTVILSGGVYSQASLNQLQSALDSDIDLRYIWLTASKEIRIKRKQERSRDAGDNLEHFDEIDHLFPDHVDLSLSGITELDTSDLSLDELASTIVSNL